MLMMQQDKQTIMHKGFAFRADGDLQSNQVWGELPQASSVDGIKVFFLTVVILLKVKNKDIYKRTNGCI